MYCCLQLFNKINLNKTNKVHTTILHCGMFAQPLLPVQATIHSLFIVAGTDVAVNNTEVFTVSMEIQQWVPCALLSSYKVYCTAINNRKYYIL